MKLRPIQILLLAVLTSWLISVHVRTLPVDRSDYLNVWQWNKYCSKTIMIYMGMLYIFWKLLIFSTLIPNNLKLFIYNLVLLSLKTAAFEVWHEAKLSENHMFLKIGSWNIYFPTCWWKEETNSFSTRHDRLMGIFFPEKLFVGQSAQALLKEKSSSSS